MQLLGVKDNKRELKWLGHRERMDDSQLVSDCSVSVGTKEKMDASV